MRSSFDILSALYQLLSVPEITDLISGQIYIGDYPGGDQSENITINTLNNPSGYLQTGTINLNIHLPEIASGRANLARFEQVINVVIPLVENAISGSYYFQINDDKGVFKDQDKDNMYFYNLRLNFQTL